MAYTTATLVCLLPSFTNQASASSLWTYSNTDGASTIDGSGYITDAKDKGMKVNDIVWCTDTDASPVIQTAHRVVAINTNGSADLSDGTTFITGTNSD